MAKILLKNQFMKYSVLFLLFLSSNIVLSQDSAGDWFKIGLLAKSLDEKIRAFETATQLDPNYIEAYYYLGLAYKKQGLYLKAEIALNKAYFTNPYALNDQIKSRISYALGTIYSELGKFDEARASLLAAKELATDSRFRGKISYELGQVYFKLENFEKALFELKVGKNLLPQNADLFDKAIALANEKKIVQEKQNSNLNAEHTARVNQVAKEAVRLDLVQKPVPQRLISPEEAATLSQRNEPNRLVEKTLQKQKVPQDDEKSRTPIQRTNRNQASKAFEKKQQIDRKSKDSGPKIQTTKKALTSPKNDESEIEETYQKGLFALQNGDWPRAVLAFEKIHSINPKYKDIQNKLADAHFNLTKSNLIQNRAIETEDPNILLMVGFVFSMIFIPMLGILIFSPTRRARLYLLQRKYEKAANIYEKLLAKNPGRFRLYPRLADIYLHENRQDEKALQIYKTIIRLNLMTKNNEKIKAILARYYLTQGRSDNEAMILLPKS